MEQYGVELWCGRTDVPADWDILSREEHDRAARFRFDRDRERWVAARVLLRRILGGATGIPARELRFHYSQYGKPQLDRHVVEFNLTHSGDLAVCAVSRTHAVGVDVEQIRAMDNIEALFATIGSPRELALFSRLPHAARHHCLYTYWTVKEACVKASGEGLSMPVRELEADLEHCREVVRYGGETWSVVRFRPWTGYVGALALKMR